MRARRPKPEGPIQSRIMALFASLFFSVPTAILIWLGINKELVLLGLFLESSYLWGCIAIFALIALISPRLYPSIIGGVWRLMVRIEKWLGW